MKALAGNALPRRMVLDAPGAGERQRDVEREGGGGGGGEEGEAETGKRRRGARRQTDDGTGRKAH